MLTLTGGLVIVLGLDREATYTEVENALNGEGFVSRTSYLINLASTPGRTHLTISVHTPSEAITAAGVPQLPAVQVMRALANALATLETGRRDESRARGAGEVHLAAARAWLQLVEERAGDQGGRPGDQSGLSRRQRLGLAGLPGRPWPVPASLRSRFTATPSRNRHCCTCRCGSLWSCTWGAPRAPAW